MNIYIANDSKQSIGGGWTFIDNLTKGLQYEKDTRLTSLEEADIVLFPSTSMISKETFQKVKSLNKKLIVRLDNVPRNSRNRNTGTSRLKQYSQEADGVIWQCEWAKWYLGSFIQNKKLETIIYNGIDQDIFNTDGRVTHNTPTYIYSRFNRDENKRWEEAWYRYQIIQRNVPNAQLYIVGNFSNEQIEYNFDFFRSERIKYFGIVSSKQEMANILKQADYYLATYSLECFPNTYLEAISCGIELLNPDRSGGVRELVELFKDKGVGYFNLHRMTEEYVSFFEKVLNE